MPDLGSRRCLPCGSTFALCDGIWPLAGDFRPEGFPDRRLDGLARLDDGHFWAGPRDRLVERLLTEAVPEGPGAAAELGCGTGRFLPRLEARGLVTTGVDGHRELLAAARHHSAAATLVHGDLTRLPLTGDQFDVVVALDVLEHVEPARFLGEVARILRPGGTFLVSVPAFPLLWSCLDEAAGHRCRYTQWRLEVELAAAGLRLERWTHYQFILFPLVLASRLLGRRREVKAERQPPRWLDGLLGWINRLEVELLGGLTLPFGSSLVARAVRTP